MTYGKLLDMLSQPLAGSVDAVFVPMMGMTATITENHMTLHYNEEHMDDLRITISGKVFFVCFLQNGEPIEETMKIAYTVEDIDEMVLVHNQ